MILSIKRADGFFDYLSTYSVYVGDRKVKLSHAQEKTIDLPPGEYKVYARYAWCRTPKKIINLSKDNSTLEVKLFFTRRQWVKMIIVMVFIIMGIILGKGMLQDFSLFLLKFYLACHFYILTVGSDYFLRIDFHD